MRRIFQNTTAIAACLSLLTPHMAAAQAAAEGEMQVLPRPSETAQPADPAPEAATPDAAPAPDAEPPVDADADAPSEAEADAEAVTAAEAEAAPITEADSDAEAVEEQPEAATADEGGNEAAAPAEGAASAEADTSATGADDLTQQETASDAAAPDEAAAAAPSDDAGVTATPSPEADVPSADTQAVPAPEPAPAEPAAEAGATATTDGDAGVAAPEAAATGTTTPDGASPAAESDASADTAAAPASGADDAVQGSPATSAAALDETATAEVTEEEITEENSRSSSEDFATPVDEAAASSAAQASSSESGGNSDLARALLLGLGGVAVGTMLSNNRQVALSTPDRIVVTRPDGTRQLIRDDVVLLRQPGSTVATENFDDGSSRTVVTRADGSRVVTIRDADLRVLRRTLVSADGTQTVLLDDTGAVEAVDVASLPAPAQQANPSAAGLDEAQLREALMRQTDLDQRFSLAQIRDVPQVRLLAPAIDVETVNFETGSAAIPADQAESLAVLGSVIRETIESNPREMFLIEGHTDTVGDPAANLALSDRRAESVALALVEYFQVPPENMIVNGYGEQFPKVQQEGDVPDNRRAAVRRITDLLATAAD